MCYSGLSWGYGFQFLLIAGLLTRNSVKNGFMVCQAIGGSTNAVLHLPALAHELGFEMGLKDFNRFAKEVPTLLGITPNGPHGVMDLYAAGGVQAVMKRLEGNLHADVITSTGQSLGDLLKLAQVMDESVIPDRSSPHDPEGGIVALFGNLAPEGCVVKQSAVAKEMRAFAGPARVFESEREALKALREKSVKEGDKISIDIAALTIAIDVSDQEMASRLAKLAPRQPRALTGYMKRYVKQVTSAAKGAYLD